MLCGIADEIKARLPMTEVAPFYGFEPNRAGFIRCPFHAGDDHASLKIYSGTGGWHCFGCQAGSTVIDFVMRLFSVSYRQAILRLDMDFGLHLTYQRPTPGQPSAVLAARRREREEKARADAEYREKAAEYRYWKEIREIFQPSAQDAATGYISPLFAKAVKRMEYLDYWLDEHLGR